MAPEAADTDHASVYPAVSEFEATYSFPFDPFQRRACGALVDGSSVLVAAPTGAGKTVVGEFAAWLALRSGGKTFYTTPIKALSNQKFADLTALHGAENVGLLTGDNSINGDAPIVVMTTEVLRNMIYEDSETLHSLKYVVLDEVHYLQDRYRGAVWEEVLIHLPVDVLIASLSATVSNAEEFAEWLQTLRGRTEVIIEDKRPVEIRHWYMGSDEMIPMFVSPDGGDPIPNPRGREFDRRKRAPGGPRPRRGGRRGQGKRVRIPFRTDVIEHLHAEDLLPAIYFIFSRRGCADAVRLCLREGVRLTGSRDAREIAERAEERVADLSQAELEVLGYRDWIEGLRRGIAAHHAGMIPPFKEVVEELFAEGLVRAVFATETLALGVNMPARTVVLESLMKFNGERHELITPGQFTQFTGRAGRRGKDHVGHAVVLLQRYTRFDEITRLATTRTYPLRSSFMPSYNMAVNLVRNYDLAEAEHLVNSSFAQFQSDRSVVKLERTREELEAYLASYREKETCERGDVGEYRSLQSRLQGSAPGRDKSGDVAAAVAALHPGLVIDVVSGKKRGRYLVLEVTKRRSERRPRVLVLNRKGSLVRFGATELPEAPRRLGSISLENDGNVIDIEYRKRLGDELARFEVAEQELPDSGDRALRQALDEHPVASCPELSRHIHFADRAARLEKEIRSVDKRIGRTSGTLARRFDQVLSILEKMGYVEDWTITDKGASLTGIYSEADLLVVESLEAGSFDHLDVNETCAIGSGFVYQTRGPEGPPPADMPTEACSTAWRQVMRLWRKIRAEEEGRRLDLTREPDPGFARRAYLWASGVPLEDILEEGDEPGDFVRSCKQLIDLLRQMQDVSAGSELAGRFEEARSSLNRGIVAYSSLEV